MGAAAQTVPEIQKPGLILAGAATALLLAGILEFGIAKAALFLIGIGLGVSLYHAAFGFTGYDDHHGYTHPAYAHSYGHGGNYQSHNRSQRSTNTYQQQQHHNSHNTYNTYQHFDDRDVVDVDGSASLDDNEVERMRQRRARDEQY